MQGLRKFVVPMMRATASVAAKKVATARPAAVCVMSTLVEREKGEEARFIRQHEEARKAEIRAKLEKVLAMEEGSAEKQEIIEQLGAFCCASTNHHTHATLSHPSFFLPFFSARG